MIVSSVDPTPFIPLDAAMTTALTSTFNTVWLVLRWVAGLTLVFWVAVGLVRALRARKAPSRRALARRRRRQEQRAKWGQDAELQDMLGAVPDDARGFDRRLVEWDIVRSVEMQRGYGDTSNPDPAYAAERTALRKEVLAGLRRDGDVPTVVSAVPTDRTGAAGRSTGDVLMPLHGDELTVVARSQALLDGKGPR